MVKQKPDPLVTSNNSHEYHRALWDNSPNPQAVSQLDGTIVDVNPAFAQLIERDVIDVLGLNIWSITTISNRDHHCRALVETSLAQTGKFTLARISLNLDQKSVLVNLSGVEIELEGNSLVLLSAAEVGNAEAQAKQLQLVLDQLPMGIFWKDTKSVFLGCNQYLAKIAGFASPQDLIGKTDYDLPWKQEEADWYRECDRRVLESEQPEYNIIEQQKQADGSETWLRTNKMVLRNSEAEIVGIVGTFEEITDRIEIEKQLQEQKQNLEKLVAHRTRELLTSKAEFERLVTNVPGSIYKFKLDLQGKYSFTYISNDCDDIFEYSAEQLIQDPELMMSLIYPEDLSNFEEVVTKSAKTLQQKHWEGRIVTPSGKTKWIQTASKPERQADGSTIWDGLMIDISDRKQAEQNLRQSQQLLHLIFDTLPQRIFWKDTNFNYLGCNKTFAHDAGVGSPDKIIGKNDFDLSWKKSAHLYRADDQVILAGGAPKINYEESQMREDGTIINIRTSKLPLKDKNGRTIGLFGSYEDITNLSNQKQQTENTKYFLEQAIDSISNPIFIKDTNHRWVLLNHAYCGFLGYTKEEMLGKSEPDFYPQEQADVYWAKDELVMLSGEPETDEEPFTDGDGNEKILVTKKSCFQDLDGNTYLLGMIVDIYDV